MRFAFFAALRPHLWTSIAAFVTLVVIVQEPSASQRFWLFLPMIFLYFLSIALFAWEKKTLQALLLEAKRHGHIEKLAKRKPGKPGLPGELSDAVSPHIPRPRKPGFYRI